MLGGGGGGGGGRTLYTMTPACVVITKSKKGSYQYFQISSVLDFSKAVFILANRTKTKINAVLVCSFS